MKNLSLWSLVIVLNILFCACHDNKSNTLNPEEPGEVADMPEIDGKIYNAGDNFVLTASYMGSGGSIDYDIELEECQHAKISFDGKEKGYLEIYTDNLDLSTLEGNPVKGEVARPSLAGFGKEISIPLEIVPDYAAGKYKLSGVKEVSGIEIAVSNGLVSSEGLTAHFDLHYVYDENYSSGFNKLDGSFMIDLPEHDEAYHYSVSPFIVELNSSVYPKLNEDVISLSDAIQVLLNTPLLKESDYGFDRDIDGVISLSTLWGRLVPGFVIPENAQIYPLSFKIHGLYEEEQLYYEAINVYPPNTFCASDVTDSSYLLNYDPAKVLKADIVKRKTTDGYEGYSLDTSMLYSLLSDIFLVLTPGNAEGIPMDYVIMEENGETKFKSTFSNHATGLNVLKNILLNLYGGKDMLDRLEATLTKEGVADETIASIVNVADNLEGILNNASGATFGWSYSKQDYGVVTGIHYYNKLYNN